MFANLKNKIREETGGDLPQLGPKHLGHGRLSRGSKGGSTSSMCSEQDNTSMLKPRVDWQLQAETLVCEKAVLEEEKAELVKKNLELSEQLKEANNYKQKAFQYQEDLDQLEGFQTQEIAKVKHLLLEREQQLSESQSSLAKAQTEISRLRSIQDQLAHLQDSLDAAEHSAEQTKQRLTLKLEECEAERVVLSEKLANVTALVDASARGEVASALEQAKDLAERRLEEARLELSDVKAKWCQQVTALETQVARLSVQAGEEGAERRAAEERLREAEGRMNTLTLERDAALERAAKEGQSSDQEFVLKDQVSSLEAAKKELEGRCSSLEKTASECERLKEKISEVEKVASETQKSLESKIQEVEKASKEREANEKRKSAELVKVSREIREEKSKLEKKVAELESETQKSVTLTKEKEAELEKAIKENQALVEKCKKLEELESEVKALKMCCEHVGRVEAEKKALEEKCASLETNQRNLELEETLQNTITRLEGECLSVAEKARFLEEKASKTDKDLAEANSEKDQLLLRNASLSQQSELNCRELQEEISELKLALKKQAPKSQIDELNNKISDLETQLAEKNKNVKTLTQRLADMKKTLQKEMKGADAVASQQPAEKVENKVDVNHEYLKHVVLKFFTSREYEAQHLTKAVATLLHFTPEEERLLRETLDWKMSWFGSKPRLGNGQTAKNIPPS
ncbi:golgin subfamily A member 1-like isoform X2 [Neocloeon triangulifer]|uniref:golgin subfamily A member 1-like isoform X2 n=1 Tax=Neocloeon triangulifer TaxID=2078957 RepID=UPI00286EEC6E|nr:golgin subfamily A member 1-like isoform X2 [Neocloeon triangulifer]